MAVILIIIDGCNEDYIEREMTPFLFGLKAGSNYASMEVSPSFATRFELFTGRSSCSTDTFVDFCEGESIPPFKLFKAIRPPLAKLDQYVPGSKIGRSLLNFVNLVSSGAWVDFARIPKSLLPYFRVNESLIRCKKDEKSGVPNNLPGILKKNGLNVDFIYGDTDSVDRRAKGLRGSDKQVIILHYSESDKAAHKYGPNSIQTNEVLHRIDSSIKGIFETFESGVDFMSIFSDHDMVEVLDHLDLWTKLMGLESRLIKDYLVFLNSPLARFWFNNREAEREITSLLHSLDDYGRIVAKSELCDNMLPDDDKYGEVIFWANDGAAIAPDFYSAEKRKGMHGYLGSKHKVPFIFYNKQGRKFAADSCKMRDFMPTILDYMHIDYTDVEGKSILAG